MSAFQSSDRSTWPELLTAEEVAAIFRKPSASAVIRACQLHKFIAAFQTHPYLWRRADIIRKLDSARGQLRRTA